MSFDNEASNRDNDAVLDRHRDLSRAMAQEEYDYAMGLDTEDLEAIVWDYANAETADGCTVEPDGQCPHGYRSPLLTLGLI